MSMVKTNLKRLATIILIICMLVTVAPATKYDAAYAASKWSASVIQKQLNKTGIFVSKNMMENSYGSEWNAIDLMCDGRDVSSKYFNNVIKTVKDNKGNLENMGGGSVLDNSKAVLALTCGGYDVTDIGGYNLLDNFADFDKVVKRGYVNDVVYALLALDSANYKIPNAPAGVTQATREKYVEQILNLRLPESGLWTYMKDSSLDPDIDSTAMVLMALAPYYDKNKDVKAAVDNGFEYISEQMNDDGVFPSPWGDPGSNTVAVTIWALCANDINPTKDARFIKGGKTLLDGMMSFVKKDGSFGYQSSSEKDLNPYATQQCYEALIAYNRLITGKNHVYDFRNNPTVTSVKSLTAGKKYFKVNLAKKSQARGYQVRYSTSKNFGNYKTKTVTSTSIKISSLKSKKTYYVKARTYKTVNGKKYYSNWSSAKKVKTK